MKKAKLLLATLLVVTVIAGILSFQANRFTSISAWKYTTMVRSGILPYYTTTFFCTSLADVYYISNGGTWYSTTLYSVGTPSGVITLRAPNGAAITIADQPCSVTTTYLTTAF
ncbi:hypothetical protein [Chitinophaga pinensis]|uniref:Uncharacterized protein n=1 Tax=Chitinophaga pinensis TaxID=79329 RepID=A0A5C6LTW9_9BACT|nr:hypothetical protein [Chitinophaga pinensis]TWW00653.1 hypothetical protein FEF09_09125 [Chitinophaga pinensis]